jgi:LPS sulfotransferase NodH
VRSADTSTDAHAVQVAAYRRMSPGQRVSMAVAMSEDVNAIAADGVRRRHPGYDADGVRWAVLRLRLGDEAFRQAWPDAPLVAP